MERWSSLKKNFKEKKSCVNYFSKKKKKQNVSIRYNVSSEGLIIWVGYDKEDQWEANRGELILSGLIKNFKLNKIGYREKAATLKYKSPYWESHELIYEYYILCPKFDFEVFSYDLSYQNCNAEYVF